MPDPYLHPDVLAVVRSWLAADPGVIAAVNDRISSASDPGTGAAQIVLYSVTGAPNTTHQGTRWMGDWMVSLWISAGRRSGNDDIPDRAATHAATAAVAAAVDRVNRVHYMHPSGATIEAASIRTQTGPAADTVRGTARTTLSIDLTIRS